MNSTFTLIARMFLGAALLIFGSNKIFHFIPMEAPTGIAGEFMNSLASTGYIFPVLGLLEVAIGILLLLKKWVAFALVLLAPISVNILLFHLFIQTSGFGFAFIIILFNAILIYKHWAQYKSLFQ